MAGLPRGLALPALGGKPGVQVLGLRALDPSGAAVPLRVSGETILAGPGVFTLQYSLRIALRVPVGTDRESDLLYPFANNGGLFLGSGALAYPQDLSAVAPRLKPTLEVTGIPSGWSMHSSIEPRRVHASQLDSFFMYFSGRKPCEHVYKGKEGSISFSLLTQAGITLPLSAAQIWRHTDAVLRALETGLGPVGASRAIRILILQPPQDFARLARGRTFATGENVLGGITAYAPKSAQYLRRMFGHGSYAYYLRDGLAHELAHLYSTAAWQGRYKSRLYPAAGCSAAHRRLIGEALTAYFHEAAMRPGAGFFSGSILPLLSAWSAKPGKRYFLDLLLLDLWLRGEGSSLRAAVRLLLKCGAAGRRPYASARALARAAQEACGRPLPSELLKTMITAHAPDYAQELKVFVASTESRGFNPLTGPVRRHKPGRKHLPGK